MFAVSNYIPERSIVNELLRDFYRETPVGCRYKYGNNLPDVNLYEDERSYTVAVLLPGYEKENLSVTIKDHHLFVTGKDGKETIPEGYKALRKERSRDDFDLKLRLPRNVNVESIDAELTNGVLTVKLAKTENSLKKAITIK